jgi:hypothetical protein
MKALFASAILLFTIGLAISIGVAAGYAAICGILNAFSGRREQTTAAAELAPTPSVGD